MLYEVITSRTEVLIKNIGAETMTAINNFSDEPRYTIKSVSVQTGIRPVTLRAWERRHDLLNPHRSDNRYRLYFV